MLALLHDKKDKRYARARNVEEKLQCLGKQHTPLKLMGKYYPGREWADHVSDILYPGEPFVGDFERGWAVRRDDSVDSLLLEEWTRSVSAQCILLYYPLVNQAIDYHITLERVLTDKLPPDLRNIIQDYSKESAETLRQHK